ncbi:hypothetical protein HDV01_006997 [Terramyces sp. JEL0728]|nr:hypothetical protein HDV01_006997 [Terramyces sp. JEL0728]
MTVKGVCQQLELEMDPFIIEHLEASLEGITDEDEQLELLEPFLEEVEYADVKGFLELFKRLAIEGDPAIECDPVIECDGLEPSNQSVESISTPEPENVTPTNPLSKSSTAESIPDSQKPKEITINYESPEYFAQISATQNKKAGTKYYSHKYVKNVYKEKDAKDNGQKEQNEDDAEDTIESYAADTPTASWDKKGAIGKRMQAIRKAKKASKFSGTIEQSVTGVGAEIEAYSQQSRFHEDTLETLANDIDMKKVNILIGEVVILQDADLRLFAGHKYGLIGRNGTGKSTIFKAIGYGILVGFPKNVKVMYVEQLDGVDPEKNVLETVLQADRKSLRAYKDSTMLHDALETADSKTIGLAIRKVLLARLEDELYLANQIATKRSGARGAVARTELLVKEVEVQNARDDLNKLFSAQELTDAPKKAMEMVQELHELLELYDYASAESKCRIILEGLGFSQDWIDGPIGNLSGGWKIRVSLAQALFMAPDILLLDEPTNHLDFPAIQWLKKYLQDLETTLVLVSHDRNFLDAIVDHIIVLKDRKLNYYVGNYDEYQKVVEDKYKNDVKTQAALDKKKAHIEKSIQEGLKQAKQKGDDKKLSQVASRKKKLNERFGVERSASGHRFKLNDNFGYYTDSSRAGVNFDKPDAPVKWQFPPPEPLRNQSSLIAMDNVTFSYDGKRNILRNVSFNLQIGEKVGIVGANGDGKSTLIQLFMGKQIAQRGAIECHPQARIGYFSQNHVDEIANADPAVTTLTYCKEKLEGKGTDAEVRGHFGAFGVTGDMMSQPVVSLSGGQAVRIAMGLTVWNNPHLLILDEPTNHLDMDSIEAVIQAIKSFEGSAIVVSHDQHFIEELSQKVYLVRDQSVAFLEGGVGDYVRLLKRKKK